MRNNICLYGAGRTGTHVLVYLLKKIQSSISFFDENTSYVKGISIDAMQSSVLIPSNTYVHIAQSAQELEQARILIVCENTNNEVNLDWKMVAKNKTVVVVATQSPSIIEEALHAGVSKDGIFAVHGIADASVLQNAAAHILRISVEDIHAMVYGGIAKDFKSKAEFVRAGGIPINDIQAGSYEQAFQKAKEHVATVRGELWSQHYRLAGASSYLLALLLSGQTCLLPLTGIEATVPALVNNTGVIQWYSDLM